MKSSIRSGRHTEKTRPAGTTKARVELRQNASLTSKRSGLQCDHIATEKICNLQPVRPFTKLRCCVSGGDDCPQPFASDVSPSLNGSTSQSKPTTGKQELPVDALVCFNQEFCVLVGPVAG